MQALATALENSDFFFVKNLIRDYRNPDRLKGIEEYYFTSYESALQFLEEINVNRIKINK